MRSVSCTPNCNARQPTKPTTAQSTQASCNEVTYIKCWIEVACLFELLVKRVKYVYVCALSEEPQLRRPIEVVPAHKDMFDDARKSKTNENLINFTLGIDVPSLDLSL